MCNKVSFYRPASTYRGQQLATPEPQPWQELEQPFETYITRAHHSDLRPLSYSLTVTLVVVVVVVAIAFSQVL